MHSILNSLGKIIKNIPYVFLALMILLSWGCSSDVQPQNVNSIRPVRLQQITSGKLKGSLELPGQILPVMQADLAFEVPGFMTEMLVEEGQSVEPGQVLAKLDSRDYEAFLESAAAQLEIAKVEANRSRALYEKNATSKQRLDAALAELRVAQSGYRRAEKAFEDTFLKTPIRGVVARVLVDDFVNVQAKEPILVIQDLSRLKVETNIPETIPILLRPDMDLKEQDEVIKPRVHLTALPDRSFPAQFVEISSMADPNTRTFAATLEISSPEDITVLPGMTAKVVGELFQPEESTKTSFVVPCHTVSSNHDAESIVWKVDLETMIVSEVEVNITELKGEYLEVRSAKLSHGDWIVTTGTHALREGMRVKQF